MTDETFIDGFQYALIVAIVAWPVSISTNDEIGFMVALLSSLIVAAYVFGDNSE